MPIWLDYFLQQLLSKVVCARCCYLSLCLIYCSVGKLTDVIFLRRSIPQIVAVGADGLPSGDLRSRLLPY